MSPSSTDRARRFALAAALTALAAAAGCGDDGGGAECGPGDAPADGVAIAAEKASASFGQFHSSPNNDCTPEDGGPTSLTIQSVQTDPAGQTGFLTLCLPRPDRIEVEAGEAIPIDDDDLVQVVDLVARTADGCRLALDRERPLSGQVSFSGFCADGTAADGYALTFSADVPLRRSCGDEPPEPGEPVDGQLDGSAAVVADQL